MELKGLGLPPQMKEKIGWEGPLLNLFFQSRLASLFKREVRRWGWPAVALQLAAYSSAGAALFWMVRDSLALKTPSPHLTGWAGVGGGALVWALSRPAPRKIDWRARVDLLKIKGEGVFPRFASGNNTCWLSTAISALVPLLTLPSFGVEVYNERNDFWAPFRAIYRGISEGKKAVSRDQMIRAHEAIAPHLARHAAGDFQDPGEALTTLLDQLPGHLRSKIGVQFTEILSWTEGGGTSQLLGRREYLLTGIQPDRGPLRDAFIANLRDPVAFDHRECGDRSGGCTGTKKIDHPDILPIEMARHALGERYINRPVEVTPLLELPGSIFTDGQPDRYQLVSFSRFESGNHHTSFVLWGDRWWHMDDAVGSTEIGPFPYEEAQEGYILLYLRVGAIPHRELP